MNKFDYETAKMMEKLISKFNLYEDELGYTIEKREYEQKYMYHTTKEIENVRNIRRFGLKLYNVVALTHYLQDNYEPDEVEHYKQIARLLEKIKGIYMAPTTGCCLYNTTFTKEEAKSITMFRVETRVIKDYLYHDPESDNCEAVISIINIPAKYLEIGLPIKSIKSKGVFRFDFEYQWRKLK